MASYRVRLAPGALAPGVRPEQVLPAAVRAAAQGAEVEASDVAVRAGTAWAVVRFSVPDDESAVRTCWQVLAALEPLTRVESVGLTKRERGRWYPLPVDAMDSRS